MDHRSRITGQGLTVAAFVVGALFLAGGLVFLCAAVQNAARLPISLALLVIGGGLAIWAGLRWRKAQQLCDQAAQLAAAAAQHRRADPRALDVDLDLGGGRRLTGTVAEVFGQRIVEVTYSKLDGRHLLGPWIALLALSACHPGRDWTARVIGRSRKGHAPAQRLLGAPAGGAAGMLADLVAIYDAGRREPLPLPVRTSYAWADARHTAGLPERDAANAWKWERDEPAVHRVWGLGAPLEVLLDPVGPGEEFEGERTRLGAFAARLWLPVLRAERSPD